jgi:hypothetical protein
MHAVFKTHQFHDNDGFSDTSTTEKSGLTPLCVRSEQVNDLDTGDQNFRPGTLFRVGRGRPVDREEGRGRDRALLVDWVSDDVHDTSEGAWTDRNHDRVAGISNFLAANKSVGGVHGNGTDSALSQVLCHFEDEAVRAVVGHVQGVHDRGEVAFELDVDNGTNNLGDFTRGREANCEKYGWGRFSNKAQTR